MIYVLGASGLAKEMHQLLVDAGLGEPSGITLVDKDDETDVPTDGQMLLGVGDPALRRRLAEHWGRARWISAVHPRATVGRGVTTGEGTAITAGCILTVDIAVGRHCLVNINATVGHDAVIGDFCVINPLAAISGKVSIGAGTLVGVGASILEGISIGENCTVGAGAVVTKDVPAGVSVVGVPARAMEGR